MEETPILKVEGLKTYFPVGGGLFGKKQVVKAVNDVSFEVMEHETFGLVGESGCGKSTLGRTLVKIYEPTEGKIEFMGKDITKLNGSEMQDFRRNVQMIFQDPYASLDPHQKVYDIVAEGIRIHKLASSREQEEKMVLELLDMVGLNAEHAMRNVHEFSGGQRQRIMIAIALACQPRLLIADEPTTALDVTIQADIIDLLKDIQKEFGMAVIMITHDLGIVANIAKKIIVMYAGKVVETGSSQDIFYRPRHPYTKALLRAVPRLDTEEEQSLESIEGTPPNMIDPPAGCAFSTRCSQCMRICQKSEPPMFEFEDGHTAQCWLYHPMAAQGNEE